MRSPAARVFFIVCTFISLIAGCKMPPAGDVHPFWGRMFSSNKKTDPAATANLPPGPPINAPAGYALAPGCTLPQQGANPNQYAQASTGATQPSGSYAAAANGPYGASNAGAATAIQNPAQAPNTAAFLQAYAQQGSASPQTGTQASYGQPTNQGYPQQGYEPVPSSYSYPSTGSGAPR